MKNRLLSIFLAAMLLLSNYAISDGLLPGLEDVYGIEVPSFINIVNRLPDQIEETQEGVKSFYSNIRDTDYYDYGEALKKAGWVKL